MWSGPRRKSSESKSVSVQNEGEGTSTRLASGAQSMSDEVSNSKPDSNIRNRNCLIMKYDMEEEARSILETRKALGMVPKCDKNEIIVKLVDQETRYREQSRKCQAKGNGAMGLK